jgi:kinesin family protein 2/24
MTHRQYEFDRAWDESVGNEQVYTEAIRPLVNNVLQGRNASVLMYGQTGTGKTYTMTGSLERIARDLSGTQLEVVFFEVHGNKCYDLLAGRKEVRLCADASERIHVRGAEKRCLDGQDATELMNVLKDALQLRRIEVTERNPISSRSHAVCRIQLLSTPVEGEEPIEGGKLTLVDLAGSERNYETTRMSAQQHRESAEINKSLMALKDCFRSCHRKLLGESGVLSQESATRSKPGRLLAAQAQTRIPCRASKLTQVLRDCFVEAGHNTAIIATISPTQTDMWHTVNRLAET